MNVNGIAYLTSSIRWRSRGNPASCVVLAFDQFELVELSFGLLLTER
jgi:hypothetical protein